MQNKNLENYFFLLFSIIPISIIIGSTVSLINILLIDLSFLALIIYKKKFNFYNNLPFKLLVILYIYLIFNSFIALDFEFSVKRNFGFLRFIILFVATNYLFSYYPKFYKFLSVWFLVVMIVILDSYFEYFYGTNILGYGKIYGNRIMSFFKDEPIVGGYIFGFLLILLGYSLKFFYKEKPKTQKFLIIFFSILATTIILFTGERSNTIKCILALIFFYSLSDIFSIKQKIISIFSFLIIFFSFTYHVVNYDPDKQMSFMQERYGEQLLNSIFIEEKRKKFLIENIYVNLYRSGINVFKNYPYFGVGNKNYRIEACKPKDEIIGNYLNYYVCLTHPHQVYIELLSEHGIIGTIIILSIIFFLMFKILKNIIISRDALQSGCFVYLVVSFAPLLPSGAFFGDYNSTFFWVNFSIMFACNSKTNIFKS